MLDALARESMSCGVARTGDERSMQRMVAAGRFRPAESHRPGCCCPNRRACSHPDLRCSERAHDAITHASIAAQCSGSHGSIPAASAAVSCRPAGAPNRIGLPSSAAAGMLDLSLERYAGDCRTILWRLSPHWSSLVLMRARADAPSPLVAAACAAVVFALISCPPSAPMR